MVRILTYRFKSQCKQVQVIVLHVNIKIDNEARNVFKLCETVKALILEIYFSKFHSSVVIPLPVPLLMILYDEQSTIFEAILSRES